MNKYLLLIMSILFFSTASVAVDFGKLNEAIDKEKAVSSVDTGKLQEAVKGEGVDYNKIVESVDKEKAIESVDTEKATEALLSN